MSKELSKDVRSNMLALLSRAEAGLDALPQFDWERRSYYDAAVSRLARELEAAGARIDDRPAWECASMAFGGAKSTCTAGTAGAIRNWCAAVRKRLDLAGAPT